MVGFIADEANRPAEAGSRFCGCMAPHEPPPRRPARVPLDHGWEAGRREARERRRRSVRRRRLGAMVFLVGALAAIALALYSGGSGARRPRTYTSAAVSSAQAPATKVLADARATSATSHPKALAATAHHARGHSPGSLPQTSAFPSPHSAAFKEQMDDLWAGVVEDSVTRALPAFFPLAAYVQVKAIGSPGADWKYRLVHDYALDIDAAHRLLGADPGAAKLIAVRVRSSYGHWVPPGACYNSVGYFEVPSARVVYRENGGERSFGIASMISWRGVWYVVHLGAVLREGDGGVVDEPSSGPGSSAYSGTC